MVTVGHPFSRCEHFNDSPAWNFHHKNFFLHRKGCDKLLLVFSRLFWIEIFGRFRDTVQRRKEQIKRFEHLLPTWKCVREKCSIIIITWLQKGPAISRIVKIHKIRCSIYLTTVARALFFSKENLITHPRSLFLDNNGVFLTRNRVTRNAR